MRNILMATVVFPLALGQAGVTLAQSAQNTQSNANNSQATAELFYMIQQLQSDVRRLQGQVEEQKHQISRLQQQSRDRYVDLDQRILDLSKAVERKAENTRESSRAAESGQGGQLTPARVYRSPGADEQKTYNEIIDLIRNKKDFDTAISRLYEFIDEYPEGDLTVNAYYWLGEVYLVKPQLEQAKQAFTIVATRFADHRKAPDAVYKLGVTHDRLGEKEQARRSMQTVIDDYPSSSAADLARKFLESQNG